LILTVLTETDLTKKDTISMASIKMDLTDRAKTRKVKIKPVMINMDITLQE